MDIIKQLKKNKKITDNKDFTVRLYWLIDAIEDYVCNYDQKKEEQIMLMFNIFKKNLTDYPVTTKVEEERKYELFKFYLEGWDNFNCIREIHT